MNEQLKKFGKNNNIFRILTIANTVFGYLFFVLIFALLSYVVEKYKSWPWRPIWGLTAVSLSSLKLVEIAAELVLVSFLACLGLGMAQSIFAKKIGMVTDKIHSQSVLLFEIVFISIAIILIILGMVICFNADAININPQWEQEVQRQLLSIKLLFGVVSIIAICLGSLSALTPAVFNTILCVKTKK